MRVGNRALCAAAQAESLRYKLLGGLPVRRACYGVLRFIMENNAKVTIPVVFQLVILPGTRDVKSLFLENSEPSVLSQ